MILNDTRFTAGALLIRHGIADTTTRDTTTSLTRQHADTTHARVCPHASRPLHCGGGKGDGSGESDGSGEGGGGGDGGADGDTGGDGALEAAVLEEQPAARESKRGVSRATQAATQVSQL